MSNNKQSMKLYTENHLIRAMAFGFGVCHKEGRAPFNTEMIEFIESLNPIELPTDEEIEDAALSFCNSQELSSDTSYYGFLGATQWLLNKIQGGNNEQ